MAHEVETMAYTGKVPWHGLGVQVDHVMNSAEAIAAAGLDWDVATVPIYITHSKTGEYLEVPDRKAVVRVTDQSCYAVVSEQFRPLQNRDAFLFFDSIVGDGKAIYHTAGSLLGGRRVWILAKLPEQIQVVGEDVVDKYLLLANGHDGSMAVRVGFTPIRVVCCNTLMMAISGWEAKANRAITIVHRGDVEAMLRDATELLGIVQSGYADIAEQMRLLTQVQLNTKLLDQYLKVIYPIGKEAGEAEIQRVEKLRSVIESLFHSGQGQRLKGVPGTAWAVVNAVGEHVDHYVRTSPERRLNSAWFGSGAATKGRAATIAVQLANNILKHRDPWTGIISSN